MSVELGIITTSKEINALAQRIAQRLGVEIMTVEAGHEDTEEAALGLREKGVNCIMARGRVADIIHGLGYFSVVSCNPTAFDICQSLTKIPSEVEEVVVMVYELTITHTNMLSSHVINHVEEVTGRRLVFLTYRTHEDLRASMHEQLEKGREWFVGTRSIVTIAMEHGRKAVELLSGEGTMLNAFNEALTVLGNQKRVLREAAVLNNVIDITKQGVITVDAGGVITAINAHALRLIPDGDFQVGINIHRFLPEAGKAVRRGTELQDEVFLIKDKKVIVNQRPLFLKEEIIGAVINVQDGELIEKLEGKIRGRLEQRGFTARWQFKDILGLSPAIRDAREKARAYAGTDYNILITGETGTGKEMFAHSIHTASGKHKGPFVVINCSALPETLLESELFGYAPGAFTGAKKEGKQGLFELANGGTIFLDEINSMNYPIQSRLLRVIEDKKVMRLGSDRYSTIDVRVIAATNRKLWDMVHEGDFRKDLYFRLNELGLYIPPLRKRKEDIPLFIEHFLLKSGYRGRKKEEISALVHRVAPHHDWPGNVRELENLLKRIIALQDQVPTAQLIRDLTEDFSPPRLPGMDGELRVVPGTLEQMEDQLVSQISALYHNDINRISALLGVSKTTGWRRLKRAAAKKKG